MKIIQTNLEAEIRRNDMRISQLYSHIENLKEENEKLRKTLFCEKENIWICPVCGECSINGFPVDHKDDCDYCEKIFRKY